MKEAYHKSHLTTEKIIEIKQALKTLPIYKVAEQFNLSKAKVSNIYLGITYRNVGDL